MKNMLRNFFVFVFLLAVTLAANLAPAGVKDATATPFFTETPEHANTPVQLPLKALPTFDRRKGHSIPTQLPAVCPKKKPKDEVDFAQNKRLRAEEVLNFLNTGGELKVLEKRPDILGGGRVLDVTGDGVQEVVLGNSAGGFDFIECKDETYQLASFHLLVGSATSKRYLELKDVIDLNKNGMPELIVAETEKDGISSFYIYEWDGGLALRSLIWLQRQPFRLHVVTDSVNTVSGYTLRDLNGDDLREVIIVDDVNLHYDNGMPAYNETVILGWDGLHYVNLLPGNYELGKFRFQATQMGDMAMLYGNYAQAFVFYKEAIFNKDLDWWSEQRFINEREALRAGVPAPTVVPSPADQEFFASYAYYRMIILHVYLNDIQAARADDAVLQEKFPGFYANTATKFWETYQATGSVSDACNAVHTYARQHQNNVEALGQAMFGFLGYQNHTYSVGDICPFYGTDI